MHKKILMLLLVSVVSLSNYAFWAAPVFAQAPTIVSTSPAQNELNVPVSANISVTFDMDMDETTINDSTFVVNARSTGLHLGTITYDTPTKTATFDPLDDFDEGEVVTVVLTTGIQSSGGTPLDSSYVWSFTSVVNDGAGTFAPHSVYPVGEGPRSVFSADLDGDGDLDLATANVNSDNVSVLLNNGDGTFAPQSLYPAGDQPYDLPFFTFAADLDGDGDLDLATSNQNSGNVSVLLNNGDGTFAPYSLYPVGSGPSSVFAADLDGDGDLDLATANWYSDDVSVLLNNGDATFAPHSVYPVGTDPSSIFAADLDGDGDLDLTTANSYSDDVSVLLNNGDGTFAPHSVYPVGDGPRSVFGADLDEDGDLDLATANWGSDNVSVLLNNGDGTFAPHSVYPVGDGPRSVFGADLDGDGDLDLTTANSYSDDVSVLLNNGDGTFAPHSVYPVGDGPFSVFSADLDGDGDLDLATANVTSDSVSVLFNAVLEVLVAPGYDTSGSAGTDVEVKFYIQNTGEVSDVYDVSVGDSLGWTIDPLYYEVALDTSEVDSVSFTVSIPIVPLGTTNRIFATAVSQAGPSVRDSASLTVTCNAYIEGWDISPGNDISAPSNTLVTALFYIQNTGLAPDSCYLTVSDSLGWDIEPDDYQLILNPGQEDSVSFDVQIPGVPVGTTDKITLSGVSLTNPFVVDSASLFIACESYNVTITEISDIGNDQGKQVRVEWTSFPGSDPLVTDFTIFRRIDSLLFFSSADNPTVFSSKDYPPGEWDMVGTYEAFGETLYSAVVPTLKDSTIAEGMYWSVFFLRAGTDDPVLYFDSPVDSGYSLDNLSPSPPAGLLASHEPAVTVLTWNTTSASDFDYYSLYRDTLSGFTPDPSNRLGFTIDTIFVDSTAQLGDTCYYLVSATDFSGNESDPSNEAAGIRYITGDVTGDGVLDLGDVLYTISYLYKGGPAPDPLEAGDADNNGVVDLGDVLYLISYLYKGGPAPGSSPMGILLNYYGCKEFQKGTPLDGTPPDQDCIEYQYDGTGVLLLKHVNAGFNCCPDDILADITIEDNIITIEEDESLESGGCPCLCLFDVDYRISNLPPGEYTIRINGLYLEEGDEILQFTVDLASSPSGIFCVYRDHYPWGIW